MITVLICSSILVFLSLMLPRGSEVTVMDVFYIANSQSYLLPPDGTALILLQNNEK